MTPTNLPPYQFEKSRHWLGYVDSIEVSAPARVSTAPDEKITLLSPIKDPTQPAGDSTFLVSQRSDEFDLLASGYAVRTSALSGSTVSRARRLRG